MQDRLGVVLMVLVEDPQTVTFRQIVAEAASQLSTTKDSMNIISASSRGNFLPRTLDHQPKRAQIHVQTESAANSWIAPAPFGVKMRVFCLPYAGGVSENLYSRWVSSASSK